MLDCSCPEVSLRKCAGNVQGPDVKQAVNGSAVKGKEGPTLQKGLDAIASSLSLLGDTLGTAIEVCHDDVTPDIMITIFLKCQVTHPCARKCEIDLYQDPVFLVEHFGSMQSGYMLV